MSLNSFAIKCIKKYQKNKAIIGTGRCKHYPSCSNYAIGCYEKFNFFKASFLTCFRIIRCNPFTRKVYDPVPLSKKEKIELKKLKEKVKSFDYYLLKEYENHPNIETIDFITYIYETTFGSYYLKEKELKLIDNNISDEEIGDDYIKVYNTGKLKKDIYNYINNLTISSIDIQLFNEKLYSFKQLVKKKKINLNYKEVYKEINTYLNDGIKYLGHSNIYKDSYNCNYIIWKNKSI